MDDEFLSVRDVAEAVKVSEASVWRWLYRGDLQSYKVGRSRRILRSDVLKFAGITEK